VIKRTTPLAPQRFEKCKKTFYYLWLSIAFRLSPTRISQDTPLKHAPRHKVLHVATDLIES
jgi:hypothetical protein